MNIKQGQNIIRSSSLLLIAILCSLQVFARESDSVFYSFSQTDTSYTFYGRFSVVAESACVMHICFNYEDIKALAPDAERVELIDEGENWNKIKYNYHQFMFYKNESLWYRTFDRENSRVDFTLISSKNNRPFMPRMISSSGYYKVSQLNGILSVEYYQECSLTKSYLTSMYQSYAKKKAVEFLYLFRDYSQSHCNITH